MKKIIIIDFNRTLYNPENNKMIDYALDLLKNLSTEYDLILLGKGDDNRKKLIKNLNIEKYFQKIMIFPEKNLEQLKSIQAQYPSNTFFYSIGDRIKKEIYLGNKMDFKTIWFKNGKFSSETPINKEEQPWKTVNSLREIEIHLK